MIKSKDDLSLRARIPTQDERRTRSSSPVKNRKSYPGEFNDDDNDMWSMNESSFSDQIKSLSTSPIARKLHITTSPGHSKYVIPIPFQLQLPPKLSSANQSNNNSRSPSPVRTPISSRNSSPSRSPSPKRKTVKLVYNGNGYEKMASSDEDEEYYVDEEKLQNRIKIPSRPKGFIRRHAADELSIINEGSETSSRQSTIKGKTSKQAMAKEEEKSKDLKSLPPTPMGSQYAPSLGSPATIKSSPDNEIAAVANHDQVVQLPQNYQVSYAPEAQYVYPNANPHLQSFDPTPSHSHSASNFHDTTVRPLQHVRSIASRSISDSSVSSFSTMSSGSVLMTNHVPLKVYKETPAISHSHSHSQRNISNTSSRSTISTVSGVEYNLGAWSFHKRTGSSIGTAPSENQSDQEEETRSSRDTLADVESRSSLTSISKSSTNIASDHSDSSSDVESDESRDFSAMSKTQPLRISRAPTQKAFSESPELDELSNLEPPSISEIEVVPTMVTSEVKDSTSVGTASEVDSLESVIDEYYNETTRMDSDSEQESSRSSNNSFNEGAGKRFSFPNSMENITNGEIARNAMREHRKSIASSRMSFLDKDGKIEIPDLDSLSLVPSKQENKDYDFDDEYKSQYTSSSYSLTKSATCSALEPLGVPSKEAREYARTQFKAMHPGEDSDSDIDEAKSIKPSKSMPSISAEVVSNNRSEYNASVPAQTTRTLPAKHSRHRSMFNIDFNIKDLTSKLSRSRSSPDIPNDSDEVVHDKVESPKTNIPQTEVVEGIVVAEPPSPVEYAVDFKDNQNSKNATDEANFHRNNYNYLEINRTLSKLNSANLKANSNQISNESASTSSSYQSSRSLHSNSTSHTSASETESVLIDLTEDTYEVCTVQRNDTLTSYRSVIEKTKDGKPIEVVLVEDDDRDLASLYSKYKNDWVNRSNSTTSSASTYSSVASFESGASSRLVVKPGFNNTRNPAAIRRSILRNAGKPEQRQPQFEMGPSPVRKYQSTRIQHPVRLSKKLPPKPKGVDSGAKVTPGASTSNDINNSKFPARLGDLNKSLPPSPSSTIASKSLKPPRPETSFDYSSNYDFQTYLKQNKLK